ncbi:MAG: quinone-dependent dihydroorotate dehydrogenase [Alphaproteobacteria bacterium]
MIYRALWPIIRSIDAETAHHLTLHMLKMGAGALWPAGKSPASLSSTVLNLNFPNPIGIAAGFDKDGVAAAPLLKLGFGFIELGTVTPRPQAGNPKPRLFRLEENKAVINRMGFNNQGVEALVARLARHRPNGVIGINIGANKDSPDRLADYVTAFHAVAPYADYITANISSPNTKGLRDLQRGAELRDLIARLQEARASSARTLPLFVKIAPDLEPRELDDVIRISLEAKLDGLIISNTTVGGRAGLKGPHADEKGGLSGVPLFRRSTDMLAEVRRQAGNRLILIGVGGVGSARDAYEKILAGASLVQLYTGLVYQGPGLIRRIKHGLAELLKADGFATISAAVGARLPVARVPEPTRSH